VYGGVLGSICSWEFSFPILGGLRPREELPLEWRALCRRPILTAVGWIVEVKVVTLREDEKEILGC
jgi:hypothetical protein